MKKLILLLASLLLITGLPALAVDVQTMSKEDLKARLNSGTLVVLDVRTGRDWSSSEFKITGAIRAPSSEIAKWSKNYTKDQTLVLYCA
jgi:rhodanese-related sulfurtransferase